ncbi:MAG: DUF3108 domain-containing protein [Sideroxydans sp.]|nr:DUF3108 domain-containing protein [Sideroxydans sp.]
MRALFLLLLAATNLAVAADWTTIPSRVQATYLVYKGSMSIAQIDEVFSRDEQHYQLTSTVKPLGLLAFFRPGKVHIKSHGLINEQGLQPLLFEDLRDADAAKNSRAEFDWEQHQLTLTNSTQKRNEVLPLGTQDRLSAMYQFMFLHLNANSNLDFAMTNGNKLDDYHYLIATAAPVFTSAGKFNTLYLDSQAKAGESRTQIWLAQEQHFLPCKVIVTDGDGDQLKQVLQSLSVTP